MNTIFLVRILLTLVLIYNSYLETGVFTGVSLILIFTGMELDAIIYKKTRRRK